MELRFGILLVGLCGALFASDSVVAQWSPQSPEIVVLGMPHLEQSDVDQATIEDVRRMLVRFQPDLVAVEWLHPTIANSDYETYTELGDTKTLARLWGISTKDLPKSIADAKGRVAASEPANVASERTRLGKLYYLSGDALNAGYQWWVVEQLGGEVGNLSRLTRDNFRGHELEALGFHAAWENQLEYLVPFDYQGDDAAWNSVYGELLEAVAAAGVPEKEGQTAEDRKALEDEFVSQMSSDPAAWLAANRDNSPVSRFAAIVKWQLSVMETMAEEASKLKLGMIGYLQLEAAIVEQERLYYQELWNLPHHGLGRQLVVNYERRNEKMASFVLADAKRLKSQRVLVIVGAGHKLFLDKIFAARGLQVLDSNAILK